MNVLACTDSNFTTPVGVMLYSLCKNNQNEDLNIHIFIDESVTEKQKKSIQMELSHFSTVSVCFHLVDILDIRKYLVVVQRRFPVSIYYRLLLAELLPSNIEKILYLDGDIIVRHSLKELWNTDIENYSLGAVINQSDAKRFWDRLNYPKEKGYFNSGVLLINVKYWRENKLQTSFLDYIKSNQEKLVFPDQDVLNYVLQDSKLLLSERFNFQQHFYDLDREMVPCENTDNILRSRIDPFCLHFTGVKPWMMGCRHPMRNEYYRYKKETGLIHDYSLEYKCFFKSHAIKKAIKSFIKPLRGKN